MNRQKIILPVILVLLVAAFSWGLEQGMAQKGSPNAPGQKKKITQADRQAAADRAAAAGFTMDGVGAADMAMPGAAPRYFSHPNYANSPLPGNAVSEWNAIAQDILQPTPMPGMPMPMGGVSMSAAFVYLSYMQAAVYNSLVAIEGGYTPYNSTLTADPNASRDAAVAAAAYGVLKNFFPEDPTLDGKYAASLAVIPDSPAKTEGIAVGAAAAAEIITLRAGDTLSGDDGYIVPPPGPGVWEPNKLPDGTVVPPMDPWMRNLQPFMRATAAGLRPPPPPALDDPQYQADLAEVRDIGSAMSATRTPEQTEVAQFWATNMVIQTNASYRNLAATQGLNLLETARLMALGNMAASDSLIATFDAKYAYNFWRPHTAIRHTNPDGTYSAAEVNTWMPLLMVPNFPEYVAGHGSFVSAQAQVYANFNFFASGGVDLDSGVTNTTRHYATAAQMRDEIVNARTWGGLHFRNSSALAVRLGQAIVTNALRTYFTPAADKSAHATVSGGIRKFVDGLPGLGAGAANNLGQYIPVAVPDTTTYPGSDYYIIELGEYTEQMHSDLPPTTLRGYRQAGGEFRYLGPAIVAQKDRPVRILFRNLLPTGAGGNLFIPTDTTVMGSGMTADGHELMEANPGMVDPQNPMCTTTDPVMKAQMVADGLCYAENRATLHLHGGISPWISDGTPHQWITPAGENTPYPEGVSVRDVPDMGAPLPGEMTFYYTNQQSARLMFYHDHAWGITRLNVYAGEAAPYIIQDATEATLISAGTIPGPDATIPLVVQDKTFVPSEAQLAVSDETWDMDLWGGPGSLWLPHVYSPAQNPGDASGVNQFGRWAYGPWFWPPTSNIEYGPVDNPYFDPACNPDTQWCEPPLIPGTPYNSMGMEAFMDTPVVNGTVYPTLTVDPKAYRFRVLNAANDRFFNLSIYQAVDANGVLCDANNPNPAPESTGVACTEVALNPAEVAAALEDPTIFPTPLAGTEGPAWISIGTEGGFLPAPVVIPAHPTTWVNDPTVFNAGNVDLHSLLTAPAERHDVIVDFSQYAGQTLILYNDAPAAFPARDPRYDYYTGNGDYRDTGGAPSTLPGYGPNTRTIMQIKVTAMAPASPFSVPALEAAFKATSLDGRGVFQNGQHPIIVGQGEYNSAYGTSFQTNGPRNGTVQIFDTSLTFDTLAGVPLTMNLKPKMIQDEMGEAFEMSYGRMSGFLGVETANAQAGLQNMILHPYTYPPTEVLDGVELPPGTALEPIATTDDGTQIWKITHNGVDTHPIHWHLYDVQLLNRVGWDGIVRKPHPSELGWKDTVRVSPLEDTIVALRPLIPQLPAGWGGLPNSIRLLDPSMPEGAYLEGANTTQREAMGLPIMAFSPDGEPVDIINHYVNYGWEYVYHCHILSHEEMDMMHAQAVGVAPPAPTLVSAIASGNGNNRQYTVTWIDNSKNETAFVIERSTSPTGPWSILATIPSDRLVVGPGTGQRTYVDRTRSTYYYQVYAVNVVGDTWDYSNPALNEIPPGGGWPTLTLTSGGGAVTPPVIAAPTNLAGSAVVKNKNSATVTLGWVDNSSNETGFLVQRAYDAAFSSGVVNATVGSNVKTFTQTVARGTTFYYRVHAFNDTTQSGWSNTVTIPTP
ncbi:MAG: multicopper oxidase domain-containing protein [Syntrophobacteraceae bacterium]|jgi:FtsP/CotA-like multicopper oxidase with cupredoxin domain|nr:multicopper oxidase domain-containing protein [Syntrophobacteraceae bacterium]